MGHRREVFRPRKSRAKIRESFEKELGEKRFERATQIAVEHYATKATGLDFATAMIAASEALAIGRELRWKRSFEDIARMAISVAESRTENKLSDFRRQTVFDLVRKSLEKAKGASPE